MQNAPDIQESGVCALYQFDKLVFIAHATVGMGLAPSVGEAALVRRIDRKNGKIERIRPTFL